MKKYLFILTMFFFSFTTAQFHPPQEDLKKLSDPLEIEKIPLSTKDTLYLVKGTKNNNDKLYRALNDSIIPITLPGELLKKRLLYLSRNGDLVIFSDRKTKYSYNIKKNIWIALPKVSRGHDGEDEL